MSKHCQGRGKTKGYGCNKPLRFTERNGIKTYYQNFGLCSTCYFDWMTNNELGKIHKQKVFDKKVKVKSNNHKREKKREFKSGNTMKLADTYFSRYIRLKHSNEGECTCFTCGDIVSIKELDNGHYQKREHKATRYHEDNCRPQCKTCNGDIKHNGKQAEFRVQLVYQIGEEKVLEVERLAKSTIKADHFFYKEIADKYRNLLNELQKQLKIKYW